ncbi:MAG: homoserine kinase [Balneolaceae bacterium]|nr:homoserine kinase [Balneolaceae bacterium]
MNSIKVFAPASVSNVACGFDVLGYPMDDVGDQLIIKKTPVKDLVITAIHGDNQLSRYKNENVVTIAVQALLDHLDSPPDFGFGFELTKKVKPGSGLGSSASSSVAGVFGVNELLGRPYNKEKLVEFAMEGERASSGVAHADNVAPSMLGGFVLVRSYTPLDLIQLDYPKDLFTTVVHPQIEVKTSEAKKMLKKQIDLKDAITQWGNVAGLVSGLAKADYGLISRSLKDVVAEPVRSMLIPYLAQAKQIAMDCGALGCSISGSGPSIFALCRGKEIADKTARAFKALYDQQNIDSNVYVSSVNTKGAEVLE